MGIATDIILLVVASFIFGVVAQKLKQPVILGYIAAGILLGPHTGGLSVSYIHEIEMLAEIGVALLMFALGLEFSLKELKSVKSIALYGTAIQIALTIALAYLLGRFLDLNWTESIWLGSCLFLSSTMVTLKTLMGQGWMGTLSSKVMIGILIVQDLAIVPLMIILPEIGNLSSGFSNLGLAVLKGAVFLASMIVFGTRIIPKIMELTAKLASKELFVLAITSIGLGIGYATHLVGLSFAFGAFMVGLVLSESDYGHQALSDIIPLRDLFSLLFFASVGMLLDPKFFYENMSTVLLLVLIISLSKGFIFAGIAKIFRYGNVIPLAVGLGLFQVGEFSFVLARVGASSGAIDQNLYSLVLTVAIITMTMTPFVSGLTPKIYSLIKKSSNFQNLETINVSNNELQNHTVILGCGRIGLQIAEIFSRLGKKIILIEADYRRIKKAKKDGFPLLYGDASQEIVLEAAHIQTADLLIVTTPNILNSSTVIKKVKEMNSDIFIVARAPDKSFLARLDTMGGPSCGLSRV